MGCEWPAPCRGVRFSGSPHRFSEECRMIDPLVWPSPTIQKPQISGITSAPSGSSAGTACVPTVCPERLPLSQSNPRRSTAPRSGAISAGCGQQNPVPTLLSLPGGPIPPSSPPDPLSSSPLLPPSKTFASAKSTHFPPSFVCVSESHKVCLKERNVRLWTSPPCVQLPRPLSRDAS